MPEKPQVEVFRAFAAHCYSQFNRLQYIIALRSRLREVDWCADNPPAFIVVLALN